VLIPIPAIIVFSAISLLLFKFQKPISWLYVTSGFCLLILLVIVIFDPFELY
jgi:hypothetical protein